MASIKQPALLLFLALALSVAVTPTFSYRGLNDRYPSLEECFEEEYNVDVKCTNVYYFWKINNKLSLSSECCEAINVMSSKCRDSMFGQYDPEFGNEVKGYCGALPPNNAYTPDDGDDDDDIAPVSDGFNDPHAKYGHCSYEIYNMDNECSSEFFHSSMNKKIELSYECCGAINGMSSKCMDLMFSEYSDEFGDQVKGFCAAVSPNYSVASPDDEDNYDGVYDLPPI